MTLAVLPSSRWPRIAVLGAGHTGPGDRAGRGGGRLPAVDRGLRRPGKLVVDTMNYWPPIDGVQQMFEDREHGSSEIVQRRLARSKVVETLNHIGYHQLEDERRPAGSPERRALGVASDDPRAAGVVADLIDRVGYDAVQLNGLAASSNLAAPSSAHRCAAPTSS